MKESKDECFIPIAWWDRRKRNTPYCEEYEGSHQSCQLRFRNTEFPISHVPASVGANGTKKVSMEKYAPHSAEMSNEAECLCSRTNQVGETKMVMWDRLRLKVE